MGLLHRLRRRWNRRGRSPLPLPARRRIPVPALTVCGLVLAAGILWLTAVAPAQAVPSTGGTSSTPTTTFALTKPVKTQVDSLTAQAQAVQAEIDTLNDQLEQKAEEYNKCLDDLDTANARMAQLRRLVADAQADKARRQAMLAERIKSVYMSGGRDQLLQLIVLSDGLQDLYNRVRLVATLAEQDQRLVSDLQTSTARLDLLIKAMDDQKTTQLVLKGQLTDRAAEIQATVDEREQTLAGLDSRVKAIVDRDQQRQKEEQARLRAELQARLVASHQNTQSGALNGGQVYHGTLPQTDNAILNQVIETAAAYLGLPYVWGGNKPSTGMDCSGFVRYVFMQHGVSLPHYSGYQAQMGIPVDPADIQPGDLLAFGFPVHHVGIYIGNGLFIHTPGDYVKIQKLSSRRDLAAIRRFPLQARTGQPLFE
jgi:peptidoglycan DL-endopeptidase CwlO